MNEFSAMIRSVVRFGTFELDARSGELRKAGVRLNLPDQPLQVLCALLERPGDLVTRDELRSRLWPADTFVDFEHGLNAAVKRLRDALGDSADAPRFIETLPRRGYRFTAPVERVVNGSAAVTPCDVLLPQSRSIERSDVALAEQKEDRRRHTRRGKIAVAVSAVLAVVGGWSVASRRHTEPPPLHVVPLTLLSGTESGATFSPDGNQVAFNWERTPGEPWDIYVKFVGASEVRRLTSDRWNHVWPSWSPDGRQIAYLHVPEGQYAPRLIHLVSALGGADLKLSDVHVQLRSIDWSPDNRYIAAGHEPEPGDSNTGIYLFPVSGGEPRRLTEATRPVFHSSPSFSRDGRHLAYVSCSGLTDIRSNCDVFVIDLNPEFASVGHARPLTRQPHFLIFYTAWTRDGRYVIYDVNDAAFQYLWRVAADGHEPPQRIETAGVGSLAPATARSADRLAFSRSPLGDQSVYRFEAGRAPEPVITSASANDNAQFSPDGRRLAFCSNRSGTAVEVWVGAADGSNVQQLTHGPGQWQCSPRWSPDGQRIAFDSKDNDGHWHIWVIDADGGIPTQLTKDGGDQNVPSWSRDGQWVYFSWDQGSSRDIWRTRVTGGQPERVTTASGYVVGAAIESSDGPSVLYRAHGDGPDGPLFAAPLTGGTPRQILPCVAGSAFDTGPRGIYYVACGSEPDPEVHVLDPRTRIDQPLGRLQRFLRQPRGAPSGFSVSPDGRSIVYTRAVEGGADLMLIENFR